jgi:hypothetical protein
VAGPLTYETLSGFRLHPLVAFTPRRLCLGVVAADIWGRDPEDFGKRRDKTNKPIEDKVSFRRLEGHRRASAVAQEVPTPQISSVVDAEGDSYKCFLARWPEPGQRKTDWIIRASQDRLLIPDAACANVESAEEPIRKLRQALTTAPVSGTVVVAISKKLGRRARNATMIVQSATVRLHPPERRADPPLFLNEVPINAVLVREVDPPAGEDPIEWLLLTNLPVDTFAQAVTVAE